MLDQSGFVIIKCAILLLYSSDNMKILSAVFVSLIIISLHHKVANAQFGWFTSLRERILSAVAGGAGQPTNTLGSQTQVGDAQSSMKAISLVAQAKTMIQHGQLEESVDKLLVAIKTSPRNREANALLGAVFLTLRQFDAAASYLYAAANISHWSDSTSVSNLAQVLLHGGDRDLARKVLAKGLAAVGNKDPSGNLAVSMGDTLFASGNYSAASEWYLSAALSNPQDGDVWIKASTIRYPPHAQQLVFAENVLMKAIDLNPNNADVYFHLGLVLFTTNRIPEAIIMYEEAIRLDDKHFEAISGLATALHSLRRFPDAAAAYRVALALQPSNKQLISNYELLLQHFDASKAAESVTASSSSTITAQPSEKPTELNTDSAAMLIAN